MKIRYVIEIDVDPPALPIREMLLNQSLGWLNDPNVCSVCGSKTIPGIVHFYLGSEYGYQVMTACERCQPAVDAEMKTIRQGRL